MKPKIAPAPGVLIMLLAAVVIMVGSASPAGAAATTWLRQYQAGGASMPDMIPDPPFPPGSHFLSIAGATFVPDSSATSYRTDSDGGVSIDGPGGGWMHAPMLLPDGARIYGMFFCYYDDADPGMMTARWYRENDPSFGYRQQVIALQSPAGIGGHNCPGVVNYPAPPYEVVDNARFNYDVEVYWSVGSWDLILKNVTFVYTD